MSTAEIESALIMHTAVAEAAGTFTENKKLYNLPTPDSHDFLKFILAIGTADDLTGQAVYAFVTLKP